jgi:hypothetical protein
VGPENRDFFGHHELPFGPKKVSNFRVHPFQKPSKWICQHHTVAAKLIYIKLPMLHVPFLYAFGLNDFDRGKFIPTFQNHYVPRHINKRYMNCYTPFAGIPKVVSEGVGVLLGASKPVNRHVYKILDLGECPEKSRFSPRWSILQGWGRREDGLVKVFLPPPPPLLPFPLCDLTPPPHPLPFA